ncbi:hypothetical protein ERHA54_50230 (plasmid) [Erwinia rhapontici]|nr:hypothetical protein ERHA54_50230 [Erwinia rhapontici]
MAFETGFTVLNLIKEERSVASENICELLDQKRRSLENELPRFVLKVPLNWSEKGFNRY